MLSMEQIREIPFTHIRSVPQLLSREPGGWHGAGLVTVMVVTNTLSRGHTLTPRVSLSNQLDGVIAVV